MKVRLPTMEPFPACVLNWTQSNRWRWIKQHTSMFGIRFVQFQCLWGRTSSENLQTTWFWEPAPLKGAGPQITVEQIEKKGVPLCNSMVHQAGYWVKLPFFCNSATRDVRFSSSAPVSETTSSSKKQARASWNDETEWGWSYPNSLAIMIFLKRWHVLEIWSHPHYEASATQIAWWSCDLKCSPRVSFGAWWHRNVILLSPEVPMHLWNTSAGTPVTSLLLPCHCKP